MYVQYSCACTYVFFYLFIFIKSSACSITVSNTTCYHSLPFLLIVFIYISFNFSKSIELIYLSNCFKYLFVSSLLVTGHLPTLIHCSSDVLFRSLAFRTGILDDLPFVCQNAHVHMYVYVCMYVCMYVYVCVCMYMYIYIYKYKYKVR